MYLLYDVIQHRMAAVGNSLLVKRKDYGAVQDVISSLTHDQLIAAAQSLCVSQKTSDPAIAVLRRYIQTIAGRIPNSFAQNFNMRLHIRALFIKFGFPAFWLTINPSNLRDPLAKDSFQKTTTALRRKTATVIPTAVAVFFYKVCTAVLEAPIAPVDDGVMGILGDVSTYFDVQRGTERSRAFTHARFRVVDWCRMTDMFCICTGIDMQKIGDTVEPIPIGFVTIPQTGYTWGGESTVRSTATHIKYISRRETFTGEPSTTPSGVEMFWGKRPSPYLFNSLSTAMFSISWCFLVGFLDAFVDRAD